MAGTKQPAEAMGFVLFLANLVAIFDRNPPQRSRGAEQTTLLSAPLGHNFVVLGHLSSKQQNFVVQNALLDKESKSFSFALLHKVCAKKNFFANSNFIL